MKSTITQSIKILLFLLFSFPIFNTVAFAQLAAVETNKSDYAPGSYVIITGSNWQPDEMVKLTLVETPFIHPEQYLYVIADSLGNIYNNEYLIEVHDIGQSFTLSATGLISGFNAETLFTDASTTANLDQVKNGSASSPIPGDWINGNLNSSQAHYGEGWSIPYRMTMEGLSSGAHELIIQWDTRKSGQSALDYITNYDNIDNPAGSHFANFSHYQEVIDPTIDPVIPGLGAPSTFPIPAPSSLGSSILGQPTASFNALPTAKKQMTIYNGTITSISYVSQGSLANSDATTSLKITFTTTNPTVVLAWGGHIAAEIDWGLGGGGSTISGSPYHTSLVGLDGGSGGQDRSLSASSVIIPPRCSISGPENACLENNSLTYISSIINPNSSTVTYSWSLINNTAGAIISGSSIGSSITVIPVSATFISGGTFNIQLIVTRNGISNICYLGSDVSPGKNISISVPQPCVINGPDLVCPSSSNSYSAVSGLSSYVWSLSNANGAIITSVTNSQNVTITAGSGCNNSYTVLLTTTTNGCSSNCEKTITVNDHTAPVITSIPANTTVSCASTVPAFNDNEVVATDNCIGTVTITHADVVTPGSCSNRYAIARTYTATDVCGNASSATQTITVNDQTAPVITSIPANTTVSCASAVPAFNDIAVVATDNCIGTVTIIHADVVTPGSCANRYSIARTYTATDVCGNASSATQTITVDDQTAPVITSI
ncbi:hypothetical protein ACFX5D_16085, partial [Flavobacterium sp. LB3P45]